MPRRFAVSLAALLLLLPGCDSPSLGDSVDATGTWRETEQTNPETPAVLTMHLTEGSGGAVTGTAEMTIGVRQFTGFTVTGRRRTADLSVTLTLFPFTPVVFSGEFHSRTEIHGVLNQAGFTNDTIIFTRL